MKTNLILLSPIILILLSTTSMKKQEKLNQLKNIETEYKKLVVIYKNNEEILKTTLPKKALAGMLQMKQFIVQEKKKAAKADKVMTTSPEDMGYVKFEQKITNWLGAIHNLSKKYEDNDQRRDASEIELEAVGYKNVIQLAYHEIQASVVKLGETTVGEIVNAIQQRISQLTSDTGWIKAEYKKNKGKRKEAYSKLDEIGVPEPTELLTAILPPNDNNLQRQAYADSLAKWNQSLKQSLTVWEKSFADIPFTSKLGGLLRLFEGNDPMRKEMYADLSVLIKKAENYKGFSTAFKKLLKDKYTDEWAKKLFEEDSFFGLESPERIIGYITGSLNGRALDAACSPDVIGNLEGLENYTLFKQRLDKYKKELRTAVKAVEVNNPEALADTLIVDMPLFYENYGIAVRGAIKTGSPLILAIKRSVQDQISNPTTTIASLKKSIIDWTNLDHSNATWVPQQFFLWESNDQLSASFPSAVLLAAAIHDAYVEIDADTLGQQLKKWAASVKDALVKNPQRCLDKARLQQNLPELFQLGDVLGQDTLFIFDELLAPNLAKLDATFTQKEFERCVWKDMLVNIKDTTNIQSWLQTWVDKYGPYAVKTFAEDTMVSLPSTEMIEQQLRKCLCTPPPAFKTPEIEHDSLFPSISFESTEAKLDINGKLYIPITYQPFNVNVEENGQKQLTERFFVVPHSQVKWNQDQGEGGKIMLYSQRIQKPVLQGDTIVSSVIELKFMIVKDIRELFGMLDLDETVIYNEFGDRSFNWGEFISKLDLDVKNIGISFEKFLDQSTAISYLNLTCTVKSELLHEGQAKTLEISSHLTKGEIKSSASLKWKVVFSHNNMTSLDGFFLKPVYNLK